MSTQRRLALDLLVWLLFQSTSLWNASFATYWTWAWDLSKAFSDGLTAVFAWVVVSNSERSYDETVLWWWFWLRVALTFLKTIWNDRKNVKVAIDAAVKGNKHDDRHVRLVFGVTIVLACVADATLVNVAFGRPNSWDKIMTLIASIASCILWIACTFTEIKKL